MLEVSHVSVRFSAGSGIQAVDDISMRLPDATHVAIVGETGSGKSVLLLAILRLLPSSATVRGEILPNGEDVLQVPDRRLREIRGGEISYVPQGGGGSMNPLLTVGFQVGEPLTEHRGFTKKQARRAAVELMRRFNLGHEERLADSYPHTFSGGMRQRAMVAMGIAAGAQIVLADEPTKGLDATRVALVAEAFNLLKTETLLVVTHDMDFAGKIADFICVMYAGQQLEYGTREELLENPLHPYTVDMIAALPENGMKYSGAGFAPTHEDYEGGCRYRPRCKDCFAKCALMPPVVEVDEHRVRCWKYVADD